MSDSYPHRPNLVQSRAGYLTEAIPAEQIVVYYMQVNYFAFQLNPLDNYASGSIESQKLLVQKDGSLLSFS